MRFTLSTYTFPADYLPNVNSKKNIIFKYQIWTPKTLPAYIPEKTFKWNYVIEFCNNIFTPGHRFQLSTHSKKKKKNDNLMIFTFDKTIILLTLSKSRALILSITLTHWGRIFRNLIVESQKSNKYDWVLVWFVGRLERLKNLCYILTNNVPMSLLKSERMKMCKHFDKSTSSENGLVNTRQRRYIGNIDSCINHAHCVII